MIYNKDISEYYVDLIHLLTDENIFICLYDKRILDKKIINLVKFLRKVKKKNE